ncbi:PREDICTED: cyclin-B1-2-like [Camelina sativa]|uniref:Cyclin-B1-2-like n=1 Tax=Camelina sativa TaxID=90675 RepID=A0ABM1QHU5_CAMSA|nr:PREDICTED: cyclin-B1-2-like [Camelina sativa]
MKNDALRFGLHGVKSDIIGSHPLDSAYESGKKSEEEMKRKVIMHTYGAALPLKMDLDRQILSRFQRPPELIPSSMLGLEVYTGAINEFGFEDYLNGKLFFYSSIPFWLCLTTSSTGPLLVVYSYNH